MKATAKSIIGWTNQRQSSEDRRSVSTTTNNSSSSPTEKNIRSLWRRSGSSGYGTELGSLGNITAGVVDNIKLESTGATFSRSQLASLNRHLGELHQKHQSMEDYNHGTSIVHQEVMNVVERLIQRLICGVGILDPRFSSKFLVRLPEYSSYMSDDERTSRSRLSYLIRLDALSSPSVATYSHMPQELATRLTPIGPPEVPQGFIRVEVHGDMACAEWDEFITPSGFLRRDKIQERFVELLALSAGGASPSRPQDVDESVLCGCPGKVVDADVLDNVLKIPADEQIFYAAGGNEDARYPDPRDFRLALVEEPAGIRLRVAPLSPKLSIVAPDIDVHLVLGIAGDGWPDDSDFPDRIDLAHPDLLVYYEAVKTGLYAVAVAPPVSLRCEERSSLWRISLPAAVSVIRSHYGPASVPHRIMALMAGIVDTLNRAQDGLKIININIIMTVLLLELEKCYQSPSALHLSWTPESVSYHVLRILDTLVISLENRFLRSYFFPYQNIFFTSSTFCDSDFQSDIDKLTWYLDHLYEESRLIQRYDNEKIILDKVQTALIHKWVGIISDLSPPTINRSRRLSFVVYDDEACANSAASTQFTKKQLEYLKIVFREILNVREIVSGSSYLFFENDELLYLISFILERALKMHDQTYSLNKKQHKTDFDKKKSRLEQSRQCLFDAVRKEMKHTKVDFTNDTILVSHVLKWLYRALDEDKRFLGPILRPYLNKIFISSYENAWHIDTWRRRQAEDEITTLRTFCRLVNSKSVNPLSGIVDAENKGWTWAQDMYGIIQKYGEVKIVLINQKGKCERHHLRMGGKLSNGYLSLSRKSDYTLRRISNSKWDTNTTLPSKLNSIYKKQDEDRMEASERLTHDLLRDTSPMSKTLLTRRRGGECRGLGDLVEALVNLNKFTTLQEISTILPDVERLQMLDTIHRISKGTHRRNIRTIRSRSQSNTRSSHQNEDLAAAIIDGNKKDFKKKFPTLSRSKKFQETIPQTYRSTEEGYCKVEKTNMESDAQKVLNEREKNITSEINKTKEINRSWRRCDPNSKQNTWNTKHLNVYNNNNSVDQQNEMFKKVFEISPIMLRGQKCTFGDEANKMMDEMTTKVDYRKTFDGATKKGTITKL